ncbi:MAG TPA: aminomethyl-transferring glycine dehydrogenase subunit GcvPA [Candidatus Binataceae bacterium]|nr:aminomethyl-transferring glycine dehydrogenase subunit GcvPA [Candidatus Binataceae bacterium]
MRFLPQTETEIGQMLKAVGAASMDDLIAHVPLGLRQTAAIKLAAGRSEAEVAAELAALAAKNPGATAFRSFLGGGYYRHYIPAAVRTITSRSEFSTSYTPYQPEASQGTLQAIFEFQTLITQLTGLEAANASMYDGASAAAEAVLMAHRLLPRRGVVAMSRGLWPDYRLAIRTYLSALEEIEIVEVPFDSGNGTIAIDHLREAAGDRLLCTVAGYPNMFGIVEPIAAISEIAHRAGALSISATAEPLALGLLKAPGEAGVDIAVGEGQSFGLPLQYGGPGVGFFAARLAHVRQMPGRLVGETRDREGRRAFCLTLATREQHIRRERATSNICTNHSLCALAVTAYLSLLGAQGLRELAERNVEIAHYTADRLASAGIRARFAGPFFNEFVVELGDVAKALEAGERRGLLAGVPLGRDYPELERGLLICATETNEAADIDLLCAALSEEV